MKKQEDDFIFESPEPFFQIFQEGLDKDINDIKKYYDHLSSASNFIIPFSLTKSRNVLSAKFDEIIKIARQTILLYMTYQPEYSLFNFLSTSKIYENTQQRPEIIFDQPLKTAFNMITSDPAFFSRLIRNYFSQDISYLFVFCWSTFPSIFNFFTSDIHLKEGYELIMQFFSPFQIIDIKISEYLLKPYFFCSFNFLSKFWTTVSNGISNYSDEKNDIFDFMVDCISTCSVFLSVYHKSIITKLYSNGPNRCMTFLFNTFLKQSFEIIQKNDHFIFSLNEIELILNFIEKSSKSTITENGKKIIHAFTFERKNIERNENDISLSNPILPCFDDMTQIKSIISAYDIGLLCEIISFSENFEDFRRLCRISFFKNQIETNFSKGFAPRSISKTNPYQIEKKKDDLFPKEYLSYWKSIESLSSLKDMDPIQFYSQFIESKGSQISIKSDFSYSSNELLLASFYDEKKDKFIYLSRIHKLENNYNVLNNILKINTRIVENDDLLKSIKTFHRPIISECCEKLKNKALNDFIASGKVMSNQIGIKISEAINIISSDAVMGKISPFIKLCSILNSFDIETDEIYISLTDGYLNLIDFEKKKIKNLMLPYRKDKRTIKNLCKVYKKALQWELLGKKFSVIIQLVEYVNTIARHSKGDKSKFNLYFKYMLTVFKNPIFFHAYLIMKMVMKRNKNSLSFFGKKNQKNYLLFDKAMKEFLGAYKFGIRCLSYVQSCT